MPHTLAQAIIASHTKDKAEPGAIVQVKVDFAFANDITAPPAIREFKKMGAKQVFDKKSCAIIPDHFTPAKDIASAEQVKIGREFAHEQNMLFWEPGRCGVEHAFLPEQGYILPASVVLGADSHTCTGGALGAFATGVGSTDLAAAWALGEAWIRVPHTMKVSYEGVRAPWTRGKDFILSLIGRIGVEGARYMALELCGDAIASMPMDDRFTMANMAIEAGAKCGLFTPDDKTFAYLARRAKKPYRALYPDKDAHYEKTEIFDAAAIEPVVALPHLPDNVKRAKDCGDIKVDQVFIGSCTNGRLSDMEQAVKILKGRQVHKNVRLIVIPASYEVFSQCLQRGWIQDFVNAGATVTTPSCGPCLGGHLGILAAGERCISTSNRNFVGRMGHTASEVVLSGAFVAAASAITGRVTDPREILGDNVASYVTEDKV